MCSADFTPVDSEFVSKLVSSLCLGDESDFLSKVKFDILLTVNSLNFDQTDIVVLVSESALETKDGTVDVKLWRSWGHDISIFRDLKDRTAMLDIESTRPHTTQQHWGSEQCPTEMLWAKFIFSSLPLTCKA